MEGLNLDLSHLVDLFHLLKAYKSAHSITLAPPDRRRFFLYYNIAGRFPQW